MYESSVTVDGVNKPISEIIDASTTHRESSYNLIPVENYSDFFIHFRDGQRVHVLESRLLFGGSRHKQIQQLGSLITKLSYEFRSQYVVDQFRLEGRVMVGICGEGAVYVSAIGIISTDKRQLDLKICARDGTFGIGTHGRALNGSSQFNSNEVVVFDKPKSFLGFGNKALRFNARSDVVVEVLTMLAKPGITFPHPN